MPFSRRCAPGFEVEFDASDHHEEHDRPPGDAVQRRMTTGVNHEGVVIREKGLPTMPGPKRDAGDDLDDDERR